MKIELPNTYIVIQSDSPDTLAEIVTKFMRKDWIPLGGVVTPHPDSWIQTMVNYHIQNDNKRKVKK